MINYHTVEVRDADVTLVWQKGDDEVTFTGKVRSATLNVEYNENEIRGAWGEHIVPRPTSHAVWELEMKQDEETGAWGTYSVKDKTTGPPILVEKRVQFEVRELTFEALESARKALSVPPGARLRVQGAPELTFDIGGPRMVEFIWTEEVNIDD